MVNRIVFKNVSSDFFTVHTGPGVQYPGICHIPLGEQVRVEADSSLYNDVDGFRWWKIAEETVSSPDRAGWVVDIHGNNPAAPTLRLLQFVSVYTY